MVLSIMVVIVSSGRNLQELVLVIVVWWSTGHGCEEMRKSTREEVGSASEGGK